MLDKYFLILLFASFSISAQLVYPAQMGNPRKTGLKNSSGEWVVEPIYDQIDVFYDFRAKPLDSVAKIAKNEYYKNSNIVVKTNFGLINKSGKFLIPLQYKSLTCRDGFCIAMTFDNENLIVDYNNNMIEKINGESYRIKENVILFNKGNEHYFRKIGSEKEFGPFTNVSFANASKIFAEKENGDKAFYNEDGSIYLQDNRMISFLAVIYLHDIHIVQTEQGMTFANREGQLYDKMYQSIDSSLSYCNNYRRFDDYGQCGEKGTINMDEVLRYFGFETLEKSQIKDYSIQDEIKEKEFEIIRDFKNNFEKSPEENPTIVLIKNLKPKNKFENYSVYNVHTKKRILNSEFPITLYHYYSGIASDKKTGKNYFITPDRHVELPNIGVEYFEDQVKMPIYSNVIVYSILDSFNYPTYYILEENGKILKTDFINMTNFYKGHALAISKDKKIYVVNEKLEIKKTIETPLKKLGTFDNNGLIFTNGLFVDYLGNIVSKIRDEGDLTKKTDFFYKLQINYLDEGGNRRYYNKYYDRKGKLLSDKDEKKFQDTYFFASSEYDYFTIYSDYYYYYYDYDGNFLGSSKDGLKLDIPKEWR
ncbi:MAG TPA: hypothetical protein DCQ50_12865 [Chryseobacterium sp.]|nr:hypothetical protein [Chryseobacterium sp.]